LAVRRGASALPKFLSKGNIFGKDPILWLLGPS
jgi:hypothetical protein